MAFREPTNAVTSSVQQYSLAGRHLPVVAGSMLPSAAQDLLDKVKPQGLVVFLTGAGVSAESGIPTFRGAGGYWRVGSREYQSQELATFAAFAQMPFEVWAWYLYRRAVCRAAEPNAAHTALARLERALAERFLLVTQNVDGLHLRAGNTLARTYQIHGNLDFMRCVAADLGHADCSTDPFPVPGEIPTVWDKGRACTREERALLGCPGCKGPGRPHVLWFDESYDEARFRFNSALQAAADAALLVVVGTTGQTSLPAHVVSIAVGKGTPLLVLNPEPSVFTEMAEHSPNGVFLQGTAGQWVPPVAERLASRGPSRLPLE